MAPALHMEDDRGNEYAGYDWATDSDTKMLCELLLDQSMLKVIAHAFGTDVTPLLNVVAEEIPEDQSDMFETWAEYEQSKWQAPQVLLSCIDQLRTGIGERDNVYAALEKVRQDLDVVSLNDDSFEDRYSVEGTFHQDIADLARAIELCQSNGSQQVRLLAI